MTSPSAHEQNSASGQEPGHPAHRQPVHPGRGGFHPAADYAGEVDLLTLWHDLLRQRWLIVWTVVLTTAAAAAVAFLMTPVYRAEVLLAPVSAEEDTSKLAGLAGQFGGLASLVGVDIGGTGQDVKVSLATLTSREFTTAFIAEKDLLPVLFEDDWDPDKKAWTAHDPEDVPTLWDAYKRFDEDVRRVREDSESGLLKLSIEWTDPRLAVDWARELVERINRRRQQEAIDEAQKSIAFLTAQLAKTSVVELQQAIYRLIEAEGKKIMLASVRDEYAFKVIDPPVVPDPDDFVKPNRELLLALGVVGGGFLGLLLAWVRSSMQRRIPPAGH
jgi:LPS O-antigen subunit length determinant protein (WzzB/FepE family)